MGSANKYVTKSGPKSFAFNAFGFGPRNCPGMRFAYLQAKLVLVHMIRKFKVIDAHVAVSIFITNKYFANVGACQ